MKTKISIAVFVTMLLAFSPGIISGQNLDDTLKITQEVIHLVIKRDNAQFIGVIIFQDAREVIIRTEKLGEISIPKHEIYEMPGKH